MGALAPATAALAAGVLIGALTRWHGWLLDQPNERSLHSAPVPRIGGLAIIPSVAFAWALLPAIVPWPISIAAMALFIVSYFDDRFDLPVGVRLVTHLLAAAWVAMALVLPAAGWIAFLVCVLAIGWMTNLFNFMDGSDGLAGGMAFIGFTAYSAAAWGGGQPQLALANLSVAAATATFLFHNVHPARIFLGDAGSIPLGFLAAAIGIFGWLENVWAPWFPVVVFSPFIVDASTTLMRRMLRRERVWQAHREHYYQRLVLLGWGHGRTARAEYLLMGACAVIGLAGLEQPLGIQIAMLFALTLVYLMLMVAVDSAWQKHQSSNRATATPASISSVASVHAATDRDGHESR